MLTKLAKQGSGEAHHHQQVRPTLQDGEVCKEFEYWVCSGVFNNRQGKLTN